MKYRTLAMMSTVALGSVLWGGFRLGCLSELVTCALVGLAVGFLGSKAPIQ